MDLTMMQITGHSHIIGLLFLKVRNNEWMWGEVGAECRGDVRRVTWTSL